MSSKTISIALLGLVLVGVALGIAYAAQFRHYGLRPVSINDQTLYVSIADTDQLRERGLGGRTGLSPDEGMLFIFQQDNIYPFWMKDMRFAIDMLWLDAHGVVIHIEPEVSPETYPQVFSSDKPARYVLEVSTGYSAAHHIKVGDKVAI